MNVLRFVIALLLLFFAVLVPDASGQSGRGVAGSGGGSSGNGTIALSFTLGQPIIGVAGSSPNDLQQGFWYSITRPSGIRVEPYEIPSTGAGTLSGSIRPNPSSGAATLVADIPAAGHAVATLYDMQGNSVRVLFDAVHDAGRLDIPLDATGLPSGAYTVVLLSSGRRIFLAFHLVR